jgi:hypothetical protein
VRAGFYRTHLLVVLALCTVALLAGAERGSAESRHFLFLGLIATSAGLSLAGSVAWALERTPAGILVIALTALTLIAALVVRDDSVRQPESLPAGSPIPARLADDLTSAFLLGTCMTSMLLGHSYLISPTMSLTPLMRLLTALVLALGLRAAVAGLGLLSWTRAPSPGSLEDISVLWLPVRWVVGLALPSAMAMMARASAKIRSTQSATGILYVAVILCFLGELTSLSLFQKTGHVL